MSDAIKSISLDDIGGLQSPGKDSPKPSNVIYNPKYVSGGQFQTSLNVSRDLGTPAALPARSFPAGGSVMGKSRTRMTEIFSKFDNSSRLRNYILGSMLALALAASVYLTVGDGITSSLAQLLSQLDSTATPETPADGAISDAAPTPPTPASPTPQAAPEAVGLENPYWALPNPLENFPGPSDATMLTQSQEARWREALAHPFVWQRYKAVMEMRAARLKGSQLLLNEALAQPKFWTRMEALLALAELGEPVDLSTVEAGLGSTKRPLMQNYFRRFRKEITGGELYIMRQAIRLVDAGTRLVILENLIGRRDRINDLYLVAATFDPNARVNSWIQQELLHQPLAENAKIRFQQVVSGMEGSSAPAPTTIDHPNATPANKVEDLTVEELSDDDVNVEEVYFLKDEDKQEQKLEPVVDDGFQQLEQLP